MPRRKPSLVTTSRVWELYCEAHGVLDAHRRYKVVKQTKENHRLEHPECFNPEPPADTVPTPGQPR